MPHSDAFALFREYPRLATAVPRLALGTWPTPVHRLDKLAAHLGVNSLWIKREDASRPDAGGNKVRGIEFLLADAVARGATSLLTIGAIGSFHVRTTAVCARALGLSTIAILAHQPRATYVRRNIAAALRAGATLRPAVAPLLPFVALREWRRRDAAGNRPCFIWPGGTSPLACIGHVNAAFELRNQIRAGLLSEPDLIFVALGSLGTAAGLALGCRLAGLRSRIVGVVVFHPWYCTAGRTARLARRTLRLLRSNDASVPAVSIRARDFVVDRRSLGRAYAHFTPEGVDMARLMLDVEGIPLDGTYTAKLYAAVADLIRRNAWAGLNLLIWHTYSRGPQSPPLTADETATLPISLRRYLSGPVQPLDQEMPDP